MQPRKHRVAHKITLIGIMLALSACVPQVQSTYAPRALPSLTSGAFHSADEEPLPLRSWGASNPKAVIVALHGFNDYSNAFAMPAAFLRKQGIAVLAYDQRGFGKTKEHGIWAGEENLTQDLAAMILAAKRRHPRTPLYVLGESMGGAVTLAAFAQPGFPKADGLILSAPAVWGGDAMNPFYRSGLWVMAHTMPGALLTGKGLKIRASDNIPMLRALGRDPLVIKKTRVDAVYGLVGLMGDALRASERIETPVLLLYGKHDQIIPPAPIRDMAKRIHAPLTMAYYPKGYHMLLRDLNAKTVWRDIAAWVKNRRSPLPSAHEKDAQDFLRGR